MGPHASLDCSTSGFPKDTKNSSKKAELKSLPYCPQRNFDPFFCVVYQINFLTLYQHSSHLMSRKLMG